MASRPAVVVLPSGEDKEKLRELAREVAKKLSVWSSQRAVILKYGRYIANCAPTSREFDSLVSQRGAVWVGNYKGPIVSVEKLTEDLEAAWCTWYGASRHG
jgi:hypothetical protein